MLRIGSMNMLLHGIENPDVRFDVRYKASLAHEKRLAADLAAAGYEVLNRVNWKHAVGDEDWLPVRDAFAKDFPWLASTCRRW